MAVESKKPSPFAFWTVSFKKFSCSFYDSCCQAWQKEILFLILDYVFWPDAVSEPGFWSREEKLDVVFVKSGSHVWNFVQFSLLLREQTSDKISYKEGVFSAKTNSIFILTQKCLPVETQFDFKTCFKQFAKSRAIFIQSPSHNWNPLVTKPCTIQTDSEYFLSRQYNTTCIIWTPCNSNENSDKVFIWIKRRPL